MWVIVSIAEYIIELTDYYQQHYYFVDKNIKFKTFKIILNCWYEYCIIDISYLIDVSVYVCVISIIYILRNYDS